MAFCTNCGSQLPENSTHCPSCGAPVMSAPAAPQSQPQYDSSAFGQQAAGSPAFGQTQYSQYGQPFTPQPVPKIPTGGMMAWAIITLLLSTIPGIVALVYVNKINKASTVEEQQKAMKTARIWCIIGTVIGILAIIGRVSANAMIF